MIQFRKPIKVSLFIIICLSLFFFIFPPVYILKTGRWVYAPYRPDGHTRFLKKIGPNYSEHWTVLKDIPNSCKTYVIYLEDKEFYQHSGVSLKILQKAYQLNQEIGYRKYGGSTITQQLVKNLFLNRDKSYIRKTREVIGAYVLDLIMSKDDQIEWYFNAIEFGPNVYGIEKASWYYFNKSPKHLTRKECAELSVLLPSPVRKSRTLEYAIRKNRTTPDAELLFD